MTRTSFSIGAALALVFLGGIAGAQDAGTLVVPERAAMHNQLTRFFSNRLDEHMVKGILGIGFLRKYHVALDVAAGTLTLSPLDSGQCAGGQIVQPFELRQGRIRVPIEYADKTGELMMGGDAYDT
jgi:hypothetical protein